jgi:phage minor structural protein
MILKLYNLEHTLIGGLKNCKENKVESELSTGDKTLSFLWHQKNKLKIPHEYYLRTDSDEFVVKENSKGSNGYRNIVATLNLEALEGRAWMECTIKDMTAQQAADYILTDTGWSCVSSIPETKLRNISMKKTTSLKLLSRLLEAFTCEIKYDTINKTVYLKEQIGEDKGTYFVAGLNLREINDAGDTYDYVTRIIPIGADGLTIESVNDGKNYLENHQYSQKIKTLIWEDTNYTDPQALKDDAVYKLNEISKPKKTLTAKVVDLANVNKKYCILSYSVGDVITVISNEDEIKEKQRITKTTQYLSNPEKNTCEIANTILSFEEMQRKLFAAAECIENITTDNGTVNGATIDSIDVTQIIGLERYIAEDIDDLKVNHIYARTDFGTPYAVIGTEIVTQLTATNLHVTGREDSNLSYIVELHANTTYGDYAKFKTVEADNLSALEERVNHIVASTVTVDYLKANYADITMANVDTANISTGFLEKLMVSQGIIANRVVGTEVVATDVLTGVNLYADDITAGTLSVDRLVFRGTEKSIVYELNSISGALQSVNVNTLNGEIVTPRSITADKIVAKSLTAHEIAASAITANEIAANTITSAELAANSITTIQLDSEAVTADKIAANTITADKINVQNLFGGDITATGTIRGIKLIGSKIYQESPLPWSDGYDGKIITNMDGYWTHSYIFDKATIDSKGFYGTRVRILPFDLEISRITDTSDIPGHNNVYENIFAVSSLTKEIYVGYRSYFTALSRKDSSGNLFEPPGLKIGEGGFTGLTDPAGNDGMWIRTTQPGIIPYTSGDQDNSHCNLGTNSWWFCNSYITNMNAKNIGASNSLTIGNWASPIAVALSTPSFCCSEWVRTCGATGWYNQTYGGGWYMTDTTYIRSYGSKVVYIDARLGVGYDNSTYGGISTNSIICNSWIRTVGACGWYSETYGGGWWMQDATYIRNFGSKQLLINAAQIMSASNMYFDTNWGVRCNTTSSWMLRQYDVSGHANATALGTGTYDTLIYTAGNVWKGSSTTTYFATTSTSDRRLKDYVSDMSIYDGVFMELQPIAFKYHDGLYNAKGKTPLIQWGFYAQKTIEAFAKHGIDWHDQELVVMEDGELSAEEQKYVNGDMLKMNYQNLIALDTHMIQTTILRVDDHDWKIRELQNQLYSLQFAFEQLKLENEQLKQAVA